MRRRNKPMTTVATKPPSKKLLISELRTVYKTLAAPFDIEDYDVSCNSKCKSDSVIEVFGSWEEGLKEAGLVKKFAQHQGILEEIADFDPIKEVKKNWKKEKTKLLERAEAKEVQSLKNQNHKIDLLQEMLDETLAKIEPLNVFVQKPPAKKKLTAKAKKALAAKPPGTLWFEFSDLQLGTLITKEELGGLNEHNWSIWEEKLAHWKNQVIEKITFYKNLYNLDRVVISCLGDMVEGQDIFKGQQWQLDRHVVDQAIFGADDTAKAFGEILLAHTDLHFDIFEVFGNHGRVGSKGETQHSCSMDKVYQRMIQLRLKGLKDIANYTYHENEVWFYFVEVYGWNHLLLHGDQGMSGIWSSRPNLSGLEKGIVKYNQMFQQQVHFLHCGHFHANANWSFNLSQILVNGSFIGTNDFSTTKMIASGPPVQLMYLFTPKVGLEVAQRLYLIENVKNATIPKSL